MSLVEAVRRADAEEVLQVLDAVCQRVTELEVSDLPEPEVQRQLRSAEEGVRRLRARQSRLIAEATRRQTERERQRTPDGVRAGRLAHRKVADDCRADLGWSRSQAKQATRAGQQAEAAPHAGAAYFDGRLSESHARILFDTLQHLSGAEREHAERELLAAAEEQDPVAFGRTCRRLLAQLDEQQAVEAEERRHARRSGRVAESEDGMLVLSARLAGVDKALVRKALEAFRRHNLPGEHRTPEQATADALVDACDAALRSAEAPTDHGVRPYVSVTIDWQTLLEGAGVAEVEGAGPLPFPEVRRLLADCGVSRLLTDPRGVAVEAGEQVRNVPAGLVRVLKARDVGCVGDGCDVPAAWCEVMHLDRPFRLDGRLSPDNAALGCKVHHDKFDRRGWKITWCDGRPVLHHPRKPPRSTDRRTGGASGRPGCDPLDPERDRPAGGDVIEPEGYPPPGVGLLDPERHPPPRGGAGDPEPQPPPRGHPVESERERPPREGPIQPERKPPPAADGVGPGREPPAGGGAAEPGCETSPGGGAGEPGRETPPGGGAGEPGRETPPDVGAVEVGRVAPSGGDTGAPVPRPRRRPHGTARARGPDDPAHPGHPAESGSSSACPERGRAGEQLRLAPDGDDPQRVRRPA